MQRSDGLHRARQLLRAAYGQSADFRTGQWAAIESVVFDRLRLLLVQRTGWGKSVVYFIATRLLRDQGSGPVLLVSPLLSLMRNQIANAEAHFELRAYSINSNNKSEWDNARAAIAADACDILLVSPERLANEDFRRRVLQPHFANAGMLVIDEAHCISDWGHDFRPDYRRIASIATQLPPSVPILATTATANNRVVRDVQSQLGERLAVERGPLGRDSLALHRIPFTDQVRRLAWLAQYVPQLPGSGIVYTLTVADAQRVADWLQHNDITVQAYFGDADDRPALEQALLNNEVKALVATVALGMGFDKPDVGFVIHYQMPGSIVAYYQQIGRAGRRLERAPIVLMSGSEDLDIHDFFIHTAFPNAEHLRMVVDAISQADDGLKATEIEQHVNLRRSTIDKCLKHLLLDGAIARGGERRYFRTLRAWQPDPDHIARITGQRQLELRQMQEVLTTDACLMAKLRTALDDEGGAAPCGRCENCTGQRLDVSLAPATITAAATFLRRQSVTIKPRKRFPAGSGLPTTNIRDAYVNEPGKALCYYGDEPWGEQVRRGKYERHPSHFDDALLDAMVEMIRAWSPTPFPTWVSAVPSHRHPDLVPNFAHRLATALGLRFANVLYVAKPQPEQKQMQNSAKQFENVQRGIALLSGVSSDALFLVDDIVDSGWTLTWAGYLLRRAGSGPVFPVALAMAGRAGDTS